MNFGMLSLDIIVLIAIFVILFLACLKMGKKFIVTLILTAYPALLVFRNLPYIVLDKPMANAIGFVVIYIILGTILWHNFHTKNVHSLTRKILDYGSLSLSYMILIISISANSVTSLQSLYTFGGYFSSMITKLDYGLVLIIPIFIILLTNKSDYN